MHPVARRLRRIAESIAAAMLAVMFAAFIIQIVFRYFFNFPVGWTSELTVVMWLWLVLWGAAFVLREDEEIRFDLLYWAVGRRARIVMGMISALAVIVLYGASLKGSWAYVTFMKVERASYLKIRMDWLFSIFVIFLIAVIVRYLWLLSRLARGKGAEDPDITKAGSGL